MNLCRTVNELATQKKPFIVVISYDMSNFEVVTLDNAAKKNIFYEINNKSNYIGQKRNFPDNFIFRLSAVDYSQYMQAYNIVYENLMYGNSYLTNLTFPTPIDTNLSLEEIFNFVKAPYKILYKNEFVCFSPEPFIIIKDNIISSYPMKGTINADIENAEKKIINDYKETAEHNTIVDLIRNDLNMVSENVRVEKFRYVERINTNREALLQVSSKICGDLKSNWYEHLGDILLKILPAGSVTGAPKEKTLEIINKSEPYKRGWYTGIFGLFDGTNFNSATIIRYIEKKEGKMFFKSGGGITVNSNPENEYNEMISKVYVPFD
ncbi:aminodeoxychorismate synthase component I [bacterium]|nr:aminodeoxychorismate synthase component I [bacterium]